MKLISYKVIINVIVQEVLILWVIAQELLKNFENITRDKGYSARSTKN